MNTYRANLKSKKEHCRRYLESHLTHGLFFWGKTDSGRFICPRCYRDGSNYYRKGDEVSFEKAMSLHVQFLLKG
jgi:hypothetical protein